eukprot:1979639-Rhodomonas_salina.2
MGVEKESVVLVAAYARSVPDIHAQHTLGEARAEEEEAERGASYHVGESEGERSPTVRVKGYCGTPKAGSTIR